MHEPESQPYEFLPANPFDPANSHSSSTPPDHAILPGLVGTSPAMRALATSVIRAARAPSTLPVLVRGGSGAGKELVARALHSASPRCDGPFVALNAATLTRDLAESELFGHLRGAFTGAIRDRLGAFVAAHSGTLFLDELGTLPLEVQAKLLRAVEEGQVRPVGSEHLVPARPRIISATCEPLRHLIARGLFRRDLYERLAVCTVVVPELSERAEDIPDLAAHLLRDAGFDRHANTLTTGALQRLREAHFPGNVRELRNVLVQCALLADETAIAAHHVNTALALRRHAEALSEDIASRRSRLDVEAARALLESANGNISLAARRAGVPRSTFRDALSRRPSARRPRTSP